MKAIGKIGSAPQQPWMTTFVNLLPLWLFSLAIMVEGFPDPPVSLEVAVGAFVLATVTTIVLVWVGWLTVDVFLYSLFPLVLLYIFDEISTSYKTPFIVICALILSIGIGSAQRSSSDKIRWRNWLVVNIVTWALASHALQAYWNMVGHHLVFGECFPYTNGCPPLAGHETPWWVLFFRP